MQSDYMKACELVKKLAEFKRRQAAASEALAKARERIAARGRFILKPMPVRSPKLDF